MSQLQFQVSIVGANQKTKATIPPPSNFIFTADSSTSSSSSPSPSLSSHFQLPCSPIAPARVILKNTENYSVYYKVYTDRPSASSSSDHSSEKNVFIHPVRGAVKPHKSVTIAVVLAPPPDPTAATRTPRDSSSAMSPEQQERKKQQHRSQTPKKVSFAGDKDSDHDHDHDNNNNDDSLDLSNHAGPYCTNRKPILRMKIEAVIILSEGSSSKRLDDLRNDEQFFVNNHEHEEEDQSADEIQLHQQRASQHQRQSKISREDFENRWKQGVQMPSRIFDIVSVKPSVSRDDYLHYLVSRKIHRCDRLVKRCEGLENQCDRLLRRVEDLKEADVIERTKELEVNKARNAASINVVALVVGVIASFAAGFTL